MNSQKRAITIVVVLGLIIGLSFTIQSLMPQTEVFEVEGTITSLNTETRSATFEYISPLKGKRREMSSIVPEDCTLKLNGAPAQLADFQAGDTAKVTVRINRKTKDIVPLSIDGKRSAEGTWHQSGIPTRLVVPYQLVPGTLDAAKDKTNEPKTAGYPVVSGFIRYRPWDGMFSGRSRR